MSTLHIQPEHKEIVRKILKQHLDPNINVWVFGSRAVGTPKPYSDLDLALESNVPINNQLFIDLEHAFEESILPWRVDIINIKDVNENFRKIIERDKVEFTF